MIRNARWAALCCLSALGIAWFTTRAVLVENGGDVGAPLDDSYIHFQYARAFSEGRPFEYTPGATPTPGATSLLWPVILAPAAAFDGAGPVIWSAWVLGWISLAALAYETARLAEGLTTPLTSRVAGGLVLTFGAYAWFAASGMEVLPFAWLLARTARRSAEWTEAAHRRGTRAFAELLLLSIACPLMRPEGVLGTLSVALALSVAPYRSRRLHALLAVIGLLAPAAVNLAATGQVVSTTASAKWLPLNPYYPAPVLLSTVIGHCRLLFFTLWNGELWTSLFIPAGGAVVGVCALPAVAWAGYRSGLRIRALCVGILALGVLLPTTYETFLVNRVRYLWPFAPGWFVGLAVLCDLLGDALAKARPWLSGARWVAGAALLATFAGKLGRSVEDVATSTRAITDQQVSLGRWAASNLPPSARVGVNDTGAIAFFGNRSTFDVVGLTTQGEARYWAAGPGSRFEHYERLSLSELPTHFIVYPEWFALDALLGTRLTTRVVSHTILGGTLMGAYEADYALLGSAEAPADEELSRRELLDVLDVADLDSEAAHSYELLDARRTDNVVFSDGPKMDGGRMERGADRFRLAVVPGGVVVARWWCRKPARLRVSLDDREVQEIVLDRAGQREVAIAVPAAIGAGDHVVSVQALDVRFASLHYWSFGPPAR